MTTAYDLTPYIGGGTTYKIYPHWTLASLFGATDQAGLKAGSSTTADQLTIVNAAGAATYFYSSGGAVGAGWRKVGGGTNDYSSQNLYIDQGIAYSRNVTTNLTVQLVGGVKLGSDSYPVDRAGQQLPRKRLCVVCYGLDEQSPLYGRQPDG